MAHVYRDLPAAGTDLKIKISNTYTSIPGATDISWDGFKRGVRNATPLSGTYVVKKPGMMDPGQIKCKVFYDPNDTVHQQITTLLQQSAAAQSAALNEFEITYADGFNTASHAEVKGFVSDFSHSAADPETGTLTADLTIEVSQIVGLTAGAPAET